VCERERKREPERKRKRERKKKRQRERVREREREHKYSYLIASYRVRGAIFQANLRVTAARKCQSQLPFDYD